MSSPDRASIRRVLVIRFGAMGDVLLATPAVRWIKRRFPDARIDFLVKGRFADLLKGNPHVDRVIQFGKESGCPGFETLKRIRSCRYDAVIDLQGSPRSRALALSSGARRLRFSSHYRLRRSILIRFRWNLYPGIVPVPIRHLTALRSLGVEDDGAGLDLVLDEENLGTVDRILKSEKKGGSRGWIALAPGAGRATKRWPVERYGEVGRHFQKLGFGIVVLGGEADTEVCRVLADILDKPVIDMAGKTTLLETAAWIRRSSLLVTNDTGVMHMAAALGTPVAALFGPTSGILGFEPFRAVGTVIESDLSCRPCSFHGTQSCPKGHFRCMLELSVDRVVDGAESLLLRRDAS